MTIVNYDPGEICRDSDAAPGDEYRLTPAGEARADAEAPPKVIVVTEQRFNILIERRIEARGWEDFDDGRLHVFDRKARRIATYAPGSWLSVREDDAQGEDADEADDEFASPGLTPVEAVRIAVAEEWQPRVDAAREERDQARAENERLRAWLAGIMRGNDAEIGDARMHADEWLTGEGL